MLNKDRIEKIVKSKIGKMLHLKINDINKSINWFNKRGSISVFFGRCIPIIRSLISIPAGISKMNITTFTIYTFCGSLIWNTILISLGKIFQSPSSDAAVNPIPIARDNATIVMFLWVNPHFPII